jgi:lysyl-tRNA synthetase class 2
MPDPETTWQPTTAMALLTLRAKLLAQVRQFFAQRKVLEVETPILAHATATDPHLHSFQTQYVLDNPQLQQTLYLQTSPEFAMKRLLAAGSGAIYQITKAFRNRGESGRYHNPEFTLLEWYRPGFNHQHLMDEVESLLKTILGCDSAQRIRYAQLFQHYLRIDPHQATLEDLQQIISYHQLCTENLNLKQSSDCLNFLMAHFIEPQLPKQLLFIYDFPLSLAALAKISDTTPAVAERFEVYIDGIELANGFHELSDANEQRQRFIDDLNQRAACNYSAMPIDERLLAALSHGLPDCAGVALGLDRLLMRLAKVQHISDVISFPVQRA